MSAGSLEQLRGTVPATPGTGRTSLWVDSISGALHKINDSAVQSSLEDYKGADIADGATLTIPTTGNYFSCPTGTTTVTAIAYAGAVHFLGRKITIVFGSARTITHNATSLILPNGQNIVTSVGIVMTFVEESSGNWRCVGMVSARPAFIATLGGTNQTTPYQAANNAYTQVRLGSVSLDTHGYFDAANFRYTPLVAGEYLVTFSTCASYVPASPVLTETSMAVLYKNGSILAFGTRGATSDAIHALSNGTVLTSMNGSSDYLELYVYQKTGAARDVIGSSAYTWLSGFKIN